MSAHTPERWLISSVAGIRALHIKNGDLIFVLRKGGKREIKDESFYDEKCHLIAAAPEMFELLKSLVENPLVELYGNDSNEKIVELIQKIEGAI